MVRLGDMLRELIDQASSLDDHFVAIVHGAAMSETEGAQNGATLLPKTFVLEGTRIFFQKQKALR